MRTGSSNGGPVGVGLLQPDGARVCRLRRHGASKLSVALALGLSVGCVAGCRHGPQWAPRFDTLSEQYLEAYWRMHPDRAAAAGLGEFAGVIPDRSLNVVRDWIAFNIDTRERLNSVPREQLCQDKRIDYALLYHTVEAELFDSRTLEVHHWNPLVYDVGWILLDLLPPESRPDESRLHATVRLLRGLPALYEQARANLDRSVPRVYCQVAIENLEALSGFVRHDLPAEFAEVGTPTERRNLRAAAKRSADAIDTFADFLTTERLPNATDGFAMGEPLLLEYLRRTEGIDASVDDLLALGHADLMRNLRRARTCARERLGMDGIEEALALMHAASLGPEELGETIAADVESIRCLCRERDLVTIPSETGLVVARAPAFARWATAFMISPGPFDAGHRPPVYYVTPTETGLSAARERRPAELNRYTSAVISIHEVIPGHLLQAWHTHRTGSIVRRALTSYAAVEGWAHYVEEMMIAEGFRADKPFYELAQILEALMRNCRFICALRMHAADMSVREAVHFFRTYAFLDESAALREAVRGTYDPGYLKYTLGKLQIMKLREDVRQRRGDAFSLKRFHDEFLRFGMPPVAVTRDRMLGPEAGPSLPLTGDAAGN